jgi:serine/threonine protein kinase
MSQDQYERIGDYEILEHLGAGGMGDVYKVQHVISGRVEAMKLIRPQLLGNKLAEERFLREIRVLADLDHANVARLFTAIHVQGSMAMIMEYVKGATIERFLQDGPLTVEETNYYIGQVLSALAYAHKRGVVHRDIKPANCMVTPEGVTKLMDFGLARSSSQRRVSSVGSSSGTYDYMPPEQIQGQEIDARTDLYALGVTMFEMVTGKLPFPHETEYSILNAHLTEQPRRPVDLVSSVPPALNDIILKLLEKKPEDRYQCAEDVQDALNSAGGRTTPLNAASAVRRVTEVDFRVSPSGNGRGSGPVLRTPTVDIRTMPQPDPPPPPPRPRTPWAAIALGGVAAVGLAGGGVYAAMHSRHSSETPSTTTQQQAVVTPPVIKTGPSPEQSPTPPVDPRLIAASKAQAAERQRQEEIAKRQPQGVVAGNTLPIIITRPGAGTPATPDGRSNVAPGPTAPMKPVLSPEQSAKLTEVKDQIRSIESGESGVDPVIENIRKQLAGEGGVLHGEVTSHQSDMKANLRQARQAISAQDPDAAAKYATNAQADLDYLKHWAGQR